MLQRTPNNFILQPPWADNSSPAVRARHRCVTGAGIISLIDVTCIYIDIGARLAQGRRFYAAPHLPASWKRSSLHLCDGQFVPLRGACAAASAKGQEPLARVRTGR